MKTYPFFAYSYDQLQDLLTAWGEKPIHTKTLFDAVYRKNDWTFSSANQLPATLKEKLNQFSFDLPSIEQIFKSHDGTKKFVFRLKDNHFIESVLLHYPHGHALCISTQRGCRMGCTFCASSRLDFHGNLTPDEIVGQVLAVQQNEQITIRNVVYMGVGEPLDNADNVLESLKILTDDRGLHIGESHITISTCGVVPGILRMAEEQWPCRLAISLHYADNATRTAHMPINRAYPLEQLQTVLRAYTAKRKQILLVEYAMVPGVNDQLNDANALMDYLKDIPSRINLIPINPIDGEDTADEAQVQAFRQYLQQHGFFASRRQSLGTDIDGACGQLRARFEQ